MNVSSSLTIDSNMTALPFQTIFPYAKGCFENELIPNVH